MTPEEVKDYINYALASSRGLTSDLASDIVYKMKDEIKEGIEKTVNGKIIELTKIVLKQRELTEKHREIIYLKFQEDKERWEQAQPILETMRKQQNFFSVGGSAIKGFIAIGAFISLLVGALHYIKNYFSN